MRNDSGQGAADVDQLPLVTVETMAELLCVGTGYVRRLVRLGRIPHVKIGPYVRFEPGEVRRWVMGQRVEGPRR